MTYLIISDVHFHSNPNPKKIEFYTNLISKYDNIIINGDFYEGRYISPERFLNSPVRPLLDLLKNKNVTYIYGNHDPERKSKEVAEFISKEQGIYKKIELGTRKYHIEHGNRLAPPDNLPEWSIKYIEAITSPIQRYLPSLVIYKGSQWNEEVLKNRYKDGLIAKDEMLICGHTHAPVDSPDIMYINSGASVFNKGKYIVLDEQGYHIHDFDCSV